MFNLVKLVAFIQGVTRTAFQLLPLDFSYLVFAVPYHSFGKCTSLREIGFQNTDYGRNHGS